MFALLLLADASGGDQFQQSTQQILDVFHKLTDTAQDFIFQTGFILAVLFVVIGFFRYLFNDPKAGQTQVQNSLIGLALLGFSKFLIDLFGSIAEHIKNSAGSQEIGTATAQVVSSTLLPLLLEWGVAFAVLAIVWGGLQWMTGNTTSGKAWVTNAIIGLGGILLAWVIVRTFATALGIV